MTSSLEYVPEGADEDGDHRGAMKVKATFFFLAMIQYICHVLQLVSS